MTTLKYKHTNLYSHSLLVLDLDLHGFYGIGRFYVQSDCFSGEGFDEDLHNIFLLRKKFTEARIYTQKVWM